MVEYLLGALAMLIGAGAGNLIMAANFETAKEISSIANKAISLCILIIVITLSVSINVPQQVEAEAISESLDM